jgi:hypothetical protein
MAYITSKTAEEAILTEKALTTRMEEKEDLQFKNVV